MNFYSIITWFFIDNSVAKAKESITFLISSLVISFVLIFESFKISSAISLLGVKGSVPESSGLALYPPWWIWLIAKAPWDFIIFALSSREGKSVSL